MIRNELYFVWSKENGQRIPVFGIRQTEFLVFSSDGWVWAPMRDFAPLKAHVWDYKDQVQYVNTDGRPGMIPEPKKLIVQDHNDAIETPFACGLAQVLVQTEQTKITHYLILGLLSGGPFICTGN